MIVKLDCIEKTEKEFLQDLSQVKENIVMTKMIELNIQNKLIRKISSSNVKHLLSLNLRSLSIKDCKVQSIEKGVFTLMLQLNTLSLARNEIESIENDSFLSEPFENYLGEINLSENKLKKIQYGSFKGLYKLQILFLDKNLIEEIDDYSFESLNNLKELNIQSNRIKKIRHNSFKHLNSLEMLRLSANKIDEVEVNSFRNMRKLTYLDINSNNIKILQYEIFNDRSKLESFFLFQNNIQSLDALPFDTMHHLRILHFCSNKIKNLKFGHFIHLENLDELKLEKNEIGTFEKNTFVGLGNLTSLYMRGNKIKQLVNGAFHSLINVQTLDLYLNDINHIEMNVFTDLDNLMTLNLDSNQISTLKDVQFNLKLNKLFLRSNLIFNLNEINSSSLSALYVSKNRVQEIKLISLMPNLVYLDLSHNRLISIKDESFLNLKRLKHLNLSYNKLDLRSEFNNISYFKGQSNLEILDLSFNQIKYLDSNVTFRYLGSLKLLNVSDNKMKFIDSYVFGFLTELSDLNLASNSLSFINENCFYNLSKLKSLMLSFNQINSTIFLKSNENYLKNLECLYLEQNRILSIGEKDFESSPKLTLLNLNSNSIQIFHEKAFESLEYLKTLKISNTSIKYLKVHSALKELDLSHLNVAISNKEILNEIDRINIANCKINGTFAMFLSNITKYIDFSSNQEVDFNTFNVLGTALESLKLRKTNLQKIDQINLKNLINLKYLDLSFNNLSFISQDSFEFNLNLEYLDFSSNSLYEFTIVLTKLKYLNLDNNRINSTNDVLKDYYSIEIFKMANNRLQTYPSFEMSKINCDVVETFLEFHLNQNQINEIKYFSFIFGNLLLANFDSNRISSIETDAFLNCRSLEYLSIAQNRLSNLTENNFHFLFSLIHLNLSFNEISLIENETFSNLNKLKSLDLNYNKLISIENDLFIGLTNLNDLYLLGQNEITFHDQSFQHLPNISTIALSESLIFKYKCLFSHNLQRDVQRKVSEKYIFYKSINLISMAFSFDASLKSRCDLIFHLFQFKIHFNLKTDDDNQLFYESCQKMLIRRENNFNHTKKACFAKFEFQDKEGAKFIDSLHPVLKVLSNFYYLVSMALLLCLLLPTFYMIFRYSGLFTKIKRDSTNDPEREIKENKEETNKNKTMLKKDNLLLLKVIEEDFLALKYTTLKLLKPVELEAVTIETRVSEYHENKKEVQEETAPDQHP
jgi:Leucine-rich repeat (LRR) protein